jgi:hypothetical protein
MQKGIIYYGESHAVIQRDGDATATLSKMSWNSDGSVTLTAVGRYCSLSDALLVGAIEGDKALADN